ncbi:pirin family protein [Massilia arenosa]|uniref:Pirin family protein n=1 Tax=Zemynaea arenosa TaxID=2561931 RepID=A0A4Y9SB68_9BURK|nr:pirin family protein [Massilia arenosa]TFW16966.1 pirin family protein [Massilia arenosa]
MTDRRLARAHSAYRDDIADLVTRRPVPGPGIDQLDPFLFLNHHGPQTYGPNNRGLPFGPHPHRGFETVTFIIEGSLTHQDSAGHASIIRAGGVQWMTAGRGIIHAEISPPDFLQTGGPLEILQLWVNLPSALKMTAPAYTGLQRDQIPVIERDGASVHLSAGTLDGVSGPVQSLTGMFMSTVELHAGGTVRFDGLAGRAVFLYVVRGEVEIGAGGEPVQQFHLAELTDGDAVELSSRTGALLLFGHGAPLREPVVAHGPFVMNTRAEIMEAISDYQAGRFGPPM